MSTQYDQMLLMWKQLGRVEQCPYYKDPPRVDSDEHENSDDDMFSPTSRKKPEVVLNFDSFSERMMCSVH